MHKHRTAISFICVGLLVLGLCEWSLTRPPSAPDFLQNRTHGYEQILAAVSELDGNPRDATNNIFVASAR